MLARTSFAAFRNDRAFLRLAAIVLGVTAVLKGLRPPNRWAATQALLDYRFGVVKRGLFGQVFTRTLDLTHYARFAAFSGIVLAIALVLLARIAWRSRLWERVADGAPIALFFSSFAVTYVANLIGYFDILQLVLCLCVVLIRHPALRFVVALVTVCAGVMVHEGFLFLFLPAILFTFAADWLAERLSLRAALASIALLFTAGVALTVLLAAHHPFNPDQVVSLEQTLTPIADYSVRIDIFQIMGRSSLDNVRLMLEKYRTAQYWLQQASAAITFAPVWLFLAWFVRRLCASSSSERARRYGTAAAILAACLPLTTHLVGWDAPRWDCWSTVTLFLALALLARELPNASVALTPSIFRAALLVIAISMASGETLLDVDTPNAFPFFYQSLRYFFHSHGHLLPPAI